MNDSLRLAFESKPDRSRSRRMVFLGLGWLFVVLAGGGVLLPLLPATPFLLLASGCFGRSSPRLQARLRRSRLFGPFLRDWERDRGVRLHVKISAVAVVVLVVGVALWRGDPWRGATIALVILATVGVTVVLRLRTVRSSVRDQ